MQHITFITRVALVCLWFCFSTVTAQQFISHAVKEGETLESIAKQYRVTPYSILSQNKEIKQGTVITPNTILVIPVGQITAINAPIAKQEARNTKKFTETTAQDEPIGFGSHKVRKKETIYSIAKRYEIREDDLKKYNRELYAQPLSKGMLLKIPKYKTVRTAENVLNEADLETYAVQEKETRWSIAHKYGITIDSLLKLNPELAQNSNYLGLGQILRLPKLKGSTLKEQEVQLYNSYTIPKKQTFYSMQKEFGVTSDEIIKLNPEVAERGLQEGMVIRLPVKKTPKLEITTDNFIFYEVKPKQTIFSLTRALGISYAALLELNPELATGLKAGMVLKLPKDKANDLEVKNALILDKINLADSINPFNKPKVLILLPFRLDKLNLADTEATRTTLETSNALKYSLGLYSGALVALDSIKKLGVSVDVKTVDTELSLARVRTILAQESLNELSAIFGPLDGKSLQEVAVKAEGYDVPVIAPLSSKSDISLENVFFSSASEAVLRERVLDFARDKWTTEQVIIIADEKHKDAQQQILATFPNAKLVHLKDNLSINIQDFTNLLANDKENWVFLETDNFSLISSACSILNSAMNTEVKIKMFTTDKNRAFDNDVVSSTHLSNLRFTYPSTFLEGSNDSFVKLYKKRFGIEPDRYAVRGFDIMLDLLLKLAYKNDLFEASRFIGETAYSGNKFNYTKDSVSGYFNKATYVVTLQDMQLSEAK
ncbi:LysM peptidoglycan-binding domain-containing protein [Arenibacter sp. GZD96]|uniref:LysM peptidoglycan-binding domain-containing protein n=1 Tax=Aurantibrevibacter litoralis TaxID=3106030 RepID=UPI002AFE1D15|nr:LysM peptidoglycan-binding domain-containing protein [Arenibacter sp. GZD-96]MEA1784986.1 LysM peptidoglycan-binding domain-containing protein [Arenibacter sp. GZD-96]